MGYENKIIIKNKWLRSLAPSPQRSIYIYEVKYRGFSLTEICILSLERIV